MKAVQLAKVKGAKLGDGKAQPSKSGRFGERIAPTPTRREQRAAEQVLGLVPFAVKLDAELVTRLHALAKERKATLDETVGELLKKGLAG
ncbi:MAG: hypothetical protein IPM02_08450 [Betaproteobacteria bacterium]|nr:hypothetical protein [Betaproteobacteria bacterium]